MPQLPYDYASLEPHFDAKTTEIHHTKHHRAKITNLNAAIDGTALAGLDIEALISDLSQVPDAIRTTVRNNGGGHANHSLFWTVLSPNGRGQPSTRCPWATKRRIRLGLTWFGPGFGPSLSRLY